MIGSEWRAIIALSSTKSVVIMKGMIGWSELNKLKNRGAAIVGVVSDSSRPDWTAKYPWCLPDMIWKLDNSMGEGEISVN